MSEYIDNVVVKLKRQYGKDELVAHMLKEQKEKDLEIGMLKSEVDELKYNLDRVLKTDEKTKQRLQQLRSWKSLQDENKSLKEKAKKFEKEYNRVFLELIKEKNKP